jgi:DNA-binding CsgD family transcriptional regulator
MHRRPGITVWGGTTNRGAVTDRDRTMGETNIAIASPYILPASRGNVHKLAGQFYEAAQSGVGWDEALENTANALGANTAAIIIANARTDVTSEFMIGGDIGREVIPVYSHQYASLDPATKVVKELTIGQVDSCHNYLDHRVVDKSPYYREFLIPWGGRYSSGARLFDDGKEWGRLGLQTNCQQGPMSGRNLETLKALTPHIQEALRQFRFARSTRQEAHMAGMLEALEQMGCGAVLVEGDSVIIQMNKAAARHLECGIRQAHGRLCASKEDARGPFRKLIADAAQMNRSVARESVFALPRRNGRPLVARVSPIFEPAPALTPALKRQAVVLVKLIDLDERAKLAGSCLRDLFDLTPAEARLAVALAGGQSLKEMAVGFGVADGTVRGQIKSIFMKTDTGGQPELISLLERLAMVGGR